MEGDPDRPRKIRLPLVREDHPATGPVSCHPARACRAEPVGDDPLCQGWRAPAAQSAERKLAREGIGLDVSTLADHVGAATATLKPLGELIRRHVLAAERVHGEDTTVPLLAKGKTITARLWTYVRD